MNEKVLDYAMSPMAEQYTYRQDDILIAEYIHGFRVFWDGNALRITLDRNMYGPGLNTSDASYLPFYYCNIQQCLWTADKLIEKLKAGVGLHAEYAEAEFILSRQSDGRWSARVELSLVMITKTCDTPAMACAELLKYMAEMFMRENGTDGYA